MSFKSTLTTDEYSLRDFLTISGYIRLHFIRYTHENFPSVIIPIIIRYFLDAFSWNAKECKTCVEFSMDNTYVKAVDNNKYHGPAYWVAINSIDANLHSYVSWEVTLKSTIDVCFAMSFIEHSATLTWDKRSWLGSYGPTEQCRSMTIYHTYHKFKIYHKGRATDVKNEKALTSSVKIGDRFELQFIFDQNHKNCNQCLFYYNGEFIAVLHGALPNKVFLPIMCCSLGHEFQTTKWNIQFQT